MQSKLWRSNMALHQIRLNSFLLCFNQLHRCSTFCYGMLCNAKSYVTVTHPNTKEVRQMCKDQFRKQAVTLRKKPLNTQRKLLPGQGTGQVVQKGNIGSSLMALNASVILQHLPFFFPILKGCTQYLKATIFNWKKWVTTVYYHKKENYYFLQINQLKGFRIFKIHVFWNFHPRFFIIIFEKL